MKGKCGRETDGRSRRPEVAEALRIQGAKAVAAGEHYYHKSSEVQGFVSQHEKKLELVFLPPYAPQTNPDEQVWAGVKRVKRHVRDVVPRTKEEFRKTIIVALWWLREKAERVKAFFRHPDTRYAL